MDDTLTKLPMPQLLHAIATNARWLLKALEENSALIPANCVLQYAVLKAQVSEHHNRIVAANLAKHSTSSASPEP